MCFCTPGRCIVGIIILAVLHCTFAHAADAPTTSPVAFVGHVTAADNKPISGALVSAFSIIGGARTTSVGHATSDKDGYFRIVCGPNVIQVIIQSKGYGIDTRHLLIGEDSLPFELVLNPGSSARVRVVDTDGKPVAGVSVAPSDLSDRNTPPMGRLPEQIYRLLARTTDASGACVFDDLPRNEPVDFRLLDPNYIEAQAFAYMNNKPLVEAEPMRIERGGIIQGMLVDADGTPLSDVRVAAYMRMEKERAISGNSVTTDPNGHFRLTQLRPGNYFIQPELRPPLSSKCAAPMIGPIAVGPGQPDVDLLIPLMPGAIVRGKATLQDGTAAPGVAVTARQKDSIFSGVRTVTDASGDYLLHVAPGDYEIRGGSTAAFSAPQPSVATVHADEANPAVVEFTYRPGRTPPLRGRVVDQMGQAAFGASVIVQPDDLVRQGFVGEGQAALTDPEGRFIIPEARQGTSLYVRRGRSRLADPLRVTDAIRELELSLIDDARGAALIRVVDENDRPLAGARVRVLQQPEIADAVLAVTGPEGTLLVPGLYADLRFIASAKFPGRALAVSNFKPSAGVTTQVPVLKLPKADGFIAGTVVDESKKPLANADVSFYGGHTDRQTVQSDSAGHFRIDGLAPGDTLPLIVRVEGKPSSDVQQIEVSTPDAVFVYKPFQPGAR